MTKELLKLTLEAIELHLLHHEHGCVYLDPVVFKIKDALQEPVDRGEFAPCPLPDREQRIQDGDLMNVMRQEVIERSGWVPSFEEALEWQRRQQARAENIQRAVDRVTPPFKPDYNTEAVLVEEMQRMAKRIEDLEAKRESAYQRGYLDGIGRECPHCKDYKAMYIKVRDELAAEQQVTQQQTARIVDLQTHIENLEGED